VDAAAQIPIKENLWRFTRDWGADLAVFSGGKGLRGPQASGLVVGKRELIDRMLTFACPNAGVGRPMKVGKEEIAGLTTAIKLYMESDEGETLARYERDVQMVISAFAGENAVAVTRDFPSEAGQLMPRAKIYLSGVNAEPKSLAGWLREAEPGVLVAADDDSLLINPQTLEPGEIEIVIEQIKKALKAFINQ
jgi:L-seryl-tRNA(Ser) seleniumtransferase